METPEKIYELVKTMPADQASEVLDFVKFLNQKARLRSGQETPGDTSSSGGLLTDYAGILKDSPNFNEDPIALQRKMRDEWS
jgi:Protein of unknown function (DUF2281)